MAYGFILIYPVLVWRIGGFFEFQVGKNNLVIIIDYDAVAHNGETIAETR